MVIVNLLDLVVFWLGTVTVKVRVARHLRNESLGQKAEGGTATSFTGVEGGFT